MDRGVLAVRGQFRLGRHEYPHPRHALRRRDGVHRSTAKRCGPPTAASPSLYTVFAKIDGEKFSAFLIERDTPGLTVGAEEHKLGIRGSSTCPLVLDDCRIPAANLLGEAGKGHHIAFNVLNVGRFKLGVACIGGARHALGHMVRYAKERHGIRQDDCGVRPDPAQDILKRHKALRR